MTRIYAVPIMWLMALAACAETSPPPVPEVVTPTPSDIHRVDTGAVAAAVDGFIADGRTGGVVTVIHQGGEEVLFRAAGLADAETQRPMARDTLFQIYSMSKPVTGVALMTLREDGKFELDDPLADYLPELADLQVYAGMDADGEMILAPLDRPITIKDLVTHTAGFGNRFDGDHPVTQLYRAATPSGNDKTLAEMVTVLGDLPLYSQPGRSWRYSLSVDVQARLVEVLSGQSFHDYLQSEIFTPLGMDDTHRFLTGEQKQRLARGTVARGEGQLVFIPYTEDIDGRSQTSEFYAYNDQPHPMELGGSGLVSTVDDYLTFARMLLGGGAVDGVRILAPETVALMATDHLTWPLDETGFLLTKGDVGFGIDFAVRKAPPNGPGQMAGAPGEFHWDGYPSTLFWVDPKNDLVAVFLTQKLPFDWRMHQDFRNVVYQGSPYSFVEPVDEPSSALD